MNLPHKALIVLGSILIALSVVGTVLLSGNGFWVGAACGVGFCLSALVMIAGFFMKAAQKRVDSNVEALKTSLGPGAAALLDGVLDGK